MAERQDDRSTAQIRVEIEQTRDELTETLDAIQDKLSPGHIVSRAAERVKAATNGRVREMAGTASETAQTMMDYGREATDRVHGRVGRNPVPAAMVGIGAAWLLVNRTRSRDNSRRERRGALRFVTGSGMPAVLAAVGLAWLASGDTGRGRSAYYERGRYWSERDVYRRGARRWSGSEGQGAMAKAGESAVQIASRAQAYATEAADALRCRGRQAQRGFGRKMRENPWIVGAGALALGAAVGMVLPESEREKEWLGDVRDRAVAWAQDTARRSISNLQNAAGDIAGDVTSRIVKGKPS